MKQIKAIYNRVKAKSIKNLMRQLILRICCISFACFGSYVISTQLASLHPLNPLNYHGYKWKPVIFVTSSEYYGAVLNPADRIVMDGKTIQIQEVPVIINISDYSVDIAVSLTKTIKIQ